MHANASTLQAAIRDVPDFPIEGILFKDITPILADPTLHAMALQAQLDCVKQLGASGINKVVGMEARGFWFGPSIAQALGAGFVPVRKPGKLPAETRAQSYGLEYGKDELHMHVDAVGPGDKVLIVDDLLATGGTAKAACQLVEAGGAEVVGCVFLVELAFLKGRALLEGRAAAAVIEY